MSPLLPLFPLQLVVFPGDELPLHIFEERYKEMVGEAEARRSEFGIVLAKDGGIVNAGCTVRVQTVLHRYPDGRFDVMTRGERRFEVTSLNQDKAYLRGEVEFFEDDEAVPASLELRRHALKAFESLKGAMEELGEEMRVVDPQVDHPQLSFQLGQAINDLDFQNRLLRSRSESDRLRQFTKFIEEYIANQQYATKVKKAAPTNGFAHKHLDL